MRENRYTPGEVELALRNAIWLLWNGLPETKEILGIDESKKIRIAFVVTDNGYAEYDITTMDSEGYETIIRKQAFPISGSRWDGNTGWENGPLTSRKWKEG